MPTERGTPLPISTAELAKWIERQGGEHWWTVDGDPLLMGRLSLPCPGDELAEELRTINLPLVVFAESHAGTSNGTVDADPLDALVRLWGVAPSHATEGSTEHPEKMLVLAWQRSADSEWLLLEDLETTANERAEVVTATGDH